MTCNMGTGDRIFRAIIGIALLGAGFYFHSWWGLVGIIPLGTALVRWCPAYVPFGFSSAPKGGE